MLAADGQLICCESISLWDNLKENSMVAFGWYGKKGGGIVGGIFGPFYSVLGPLGSKISMAAFALICATILTDLSFISLLFKLVKGVLIVW